MKHLKIHHVDITPALEEIELDLSSVIIELSFDNTEVKKIIFQQLNRHERYGIRTRGHTD